MRHTSQHTERVKIIASFILPVIFVALLWVITVFDQELNLRLWRYGVLPLTAPGLIGILFYPLIHAGFGHLASNTLPLLILGALTMYFYRPIAIKLFFIIYFVSGLLIWIIARQGSYIVGASGIIYGLAGFLIFRPALFAETGTCLLFRFLLFLFTAV